MKITVNEVVYDIVKEEKIYNSCDGCFMRTVLTIMDDCKGFTGIDCVEEEVIFLKIPDILKNCHNCKGFSEYRCSECKNYDKWEAKE